MWRIWFEGEQISLPETPTGLSLTLTGLLVKIKRIGRTEGGAGTLSNKWYLSKLLYN